ncbi:DegV family protein [Clostridioides difficile]
MNDIVIITDSSCDLSLDYLNENNIILLPLTVEIHGEIYKDIIELNTNKFYSLIDDKTAIPKTAGVNLYTFEQVFKEELLKGNEILYIGISSEISSTFSSAYQAKLQLGSDKIHLIDSRSAAYGQGLLVEIANDMKKKGKNVNEIIKLIEDIIPRMDYAVMINDIEMLKRSGRISAMTSFAGNLLNIKPVICVEDGKVEILKKVKGTKSAINFLVNRLTELKPDNKFPIVIYYGSDCDLKNMVNDKLTNLFPSSKIKSMQIGATIGSHTGKYGVGIFFVKDK